MGDQLHDVGEDRVVTNFLCAHYQRTRGVLGATDNTIIRFFTDRQWFSGEHAFVDRTVTFEYHAINRDLFAGSQAQAITDHNRRQGDLAFVPLVIETMGALGCQAQQRLNGVGRSTACFQFHHLAEQGQGDNHRR